MDLLLRMVIGMGIGGGLGFGSAFLLEMTVPIDGWNVDYLGVIPKLVLVASSWPE